MGHFRSVKVSLDIDPAQVEAIKLKKRCFLKRLKANFISRYFISFMVIADQLNVDNEGFMHFRKTDRTVLSSFFMTSKRHISRSGVTILA